MTPAFYKITAKSGDKSTSTPVLQPCVDGIYSLDIKWLLGTFHSCSQGTGTLGTWSITAKDVPVGILAQEVQHLFQPKP